MLDPLARRSGGYGTILTVLSTLRIKKKFPHNSFLQVGDRGELLRLSILILNLIFCRSGVAFDLFVLLISVDWKSFVSLLFGADRFVVSD